MRFDPAQVLLQISNLKLQFPDIWDDGDEQLLSDCLEAETTMHEFLRVVEDRRQDAASMAGGIASRIAELELRQKRLEHREQAMRVLAFKIMEAAELNKMELPEATLSIRNGVPKVIITDEAILPDILCRIKREPDKTKIKELLTKGNPVRGAELSNAEPYLQVRTR